jgi:hypothetical protein
MTPWRAAARIAGCGIIPTSCIVPVHDTQFVDKAEDGCPRAIKTVARHEN